MRSSVLVADDDQQQRRYLSAILSAAGFSVETAEGGAVAVDLLREREAEFSACVLDLHMPDLDGLSVLREVRAAGVGTPILVLTADGSVRSAVDAMRAGAMDFLVKPVAPERLEVSIRNLLEIEALSSEVRRLTRRETGRLDFDDLIAESPEIRAAIALARKASSADIPVLISGESGTGKEVFARAIHGAGPRAGRPFVAVNCGAIPPDLVESILFGHERGAFTGAVERRPGKFKEASGGTLFLDEVGELPMSAQVKLLRAIQTGEIDPVGATGSSRVDIRLISATNRDLRAMVREGRFREDLYYRLGVFPLDLPPLRERREDLPGLAEMFLARHRPTASVRIRDFAPEALSAIVSADWPGNVRQLENVIHRAVILADGPTIRREHLVGLEGGGAEESVDFAMRARNVFLRPDGHVRRLAELEEAAIRHAVTHYRGRMAEVARRLGIGRSTLYRKLDEYGIRKLEG